MENLVKIVYEPYPYWQEKELHLPQSQASICLGLLPLLTDFSQNFDTWILDHFSGKEIIVVR